MGTLFIHSHALKHVDEAQIRHAWRNPVETAWREREDGREEYVVVGSDRAGRLIELTVVEEGGDYLVYHANTPPTARALRELGIRRR